MSVLLFLVGIFLFIGLVVVHEFGHFIVARRNGVEVEEFGIFFPPRLYKKRTKGGWDFTINLIPLGGFVRLKGEHDSDTEKGTFGAASLWVKSKIMAAGVAMNLVTALGLFTLLALVGMPKIIPNQYTVASDTKLSSQQVLILQVEPGSPAQKAGLKAQDTLNKIGLPGQKPILIQDSTKLPSVTKSLAGQVVTIYYSRTGRSVQANTKLLSTDEVNKSQKTQQPKGYLGIVPNQLNLQRSTWSAPVVAVGLSAQITVLTFQGLGHALSGLGSLIAGLVSGNTVARQHGQTSASSQVTGPVGIYRILKTGSRIGYEFMLFIIAIISLTLAIMNFLPIPALDGGRLWLTLVARALKRPMSAKLEETINAIGFIVLIGLMILITVVDVQR
ncbi:MAG: RIP metalloprotease RseP [Candidatus Saccharimonadales bacterium]